MQNPKPNLKKEHLYNKLTCLVAQRVRSLPVMQEMRVQPLGWEDPLKEEMATYSSILGESHGQSSLVGYSPWGSQRVRHD